MKKVYIMRGIPGSGKSTYIIKKMKEIGLNYDSSVQRDVVVSADHYFETPNGYVFQGIKLGEAHRQCQSKFREYLYSHPAENIFVDNTNTTIKEMEFYVKECQKANVPFVIVNVYCDVEKAAARNSHNVPADKVRQMHARMVANDSELPLDWPQEHYYSE